MLSFIKNILFKRVLGPQSAGTGTTNTTSTDVNGFDTISWLVDFGAIVSGASVTIKQQGSTDNSTFVDLASTAVTVADTDDSLGVLIEHVRPKYRYMRLSIVVATQNATINLVYSMLGINARNLPVTQSTGSISQSSQIISAAAGTA